MKDPIKVVSDPETAAGSMTSVEFRIAREALGLTGEALAELLGVTDRSIRKWENGASRVPAGVVQELGVLQDSFERTVSALVAEVAGVEDAVLEVVAPGGWSRMIAGRVAVATGARVKVAEDQS